MPSTNLPTFPLGASPVLFVNWQTAPIPPAREGTATTPTTVTYTVQKQGATAVLGPFVLGVGTEVTEVSEGLTRCDLPAISTAGAYDVRAVGTGDVAAVVTGRFYVDGSPIET